MKDVLASAFGLVLIAVVASDVFRALLVPRATTRAFSLGPFIGRAAYPAWHAIADRLPTPGGRQSARASFAPLVLVLLLFVWAAVLITGFGLIFWACRAEFSPGFADVGDAVYAAGQVFTTLGIASAVTGTARIAVIACGVAGLAIVTVVATFLISVQAAFARRETLVLRMEAHVGLPPTGIAILETFAREEVTSRLPAFFESWEIWAAEVALSHRAFPILVFFRSGDSRCEWPVALGAALDAAALIDAACEEPEPGTRAAAHFLLRMGARLLGDLATQVAAGQRPRAPGGRRLYAVGRRGRSLRPLCGAPRNLCRSALRAGDASGGHGRRRRRPAVRSVETLI